MKKNEKILKIIFFSSLALFIILLFIYLLISRQSKKLGVKPTPTPSPVYLPTASGKDYKTFKNYDGSYTAVAFTGPVNYVDENGQLQPIRSTITASKMPGYAYEVTTNSVKTYFKDTLNEVDYVQVVDGDKKIYQGIAEGQEDIGTVNFSKAQVNNNTIIYPEILPGIDLRYTVERDKVLEEYIIKNQVAAEKLKSFIEFLTLENVELKKDVDGNISLGKSLGFYKPTMFEQETNQNVPEESINFEESQISTSKFILKKAISNEGIKWLHQAERKYPIIIDPTVTFTGTAGTDDGFSKQGTNYPVNVAGVTGIIGYSSVAYTAGFRFHPNIPRSSTITSAYLYIYHTQNIGGIAGNPDLKIRGEEPTVSSGCTAYGTGADDAPGISLRRETNSTAATVDWNPSWAEDKWIPSNYSVPNISSVVSEVISDSDWTAGTSSLCIMADNDTGTTIWTAFDTYEQTNTPDADDGDPCGNNTTDPCIVINYTISTPASPHTHSDDGAHVTIDWTAVTGVSQYKIYYSSTSTVDCSTLLTTKTGSVVTHDDTTAGAPTINAPSNLTASTDQSAHIAVNASTAGTAADGATRYYKVLAYDGTSQTSPCASATVINGYRPSGTVSGYDIFYNGDAYASALATNQAIPYNDTAAAAPTLTAPSGLTTSTTTGGGSTCSTIRLTIGTPGASTNGASRQYKLKTRTSSNLLSALNTTASSAGYRSYGTFSGGYKIYNNSGGGLLATNVTSPYDDTAAPTPVMVAGITPSAGTYSTKISFNVPAGITSGARAYNAQTCAGSPACTNLSVTSAPSLSGNTTGAVTLYTIDVADTSSSTTYGTIGTNATVPYDWTGCSLDIHGWYRSTFTITGGCSSPPSHTTGGVEGYCSNPTAPKNFLMEGVQFTGVQIAP